MGCQHSYPYSGQIPNKCMFCGHVLVCAVCGNDRYPFKRGTVDDLCYTCWLWSKTYMKVIQVGQVDVSKV